MKKFLVVVLLLCLGLCCTACGEEPATGTELEALLGSAQVGVLQSQAEENLRAAGISLSAGKTAGANLYFDEYTFTPEDALYHGFALQREKDVRLRFTPAFVYRGEEIPSRLAGVEFTVTAEDSADFAAWVRKQLKDAPQLSSRESGVKGDVYLVRCFSELTEREYTRLAKMTRQSRMRYGSETDLLNDPLAMLSDDFGEHLALVRQWQEVPMYKVTLTENKKGEATLSVEAYGEALYRGLQ
ncbi:MAG: hypothetical protein IKU17_04045 [Clostridia bacterium]|nr:hypothetical protein [Clostridia bacterium]